MAINGFGNNNLLGNKKLVTQQPTVAVKPSDVDSKAKQPEQPEAKLSAVWDANSENDGNWQEGDVIIGYGCYYRVKKVNGDGTYELKWINRTQIKESDFERYRGDYVYWGRKSWTL